jgi:hydroxyacylglutathione hydrolase
MTSPVDVQQIVAGPWSQNCYVVSVASGDSAVVDPGGSADSIARHIAANRLRVHAVLATHGHHDHVGALPDIVAMTDAPFGIHSGDSGLLRRVNFCRSMLHELGPIEMPPIGIDLAGTTALRFGDLELTVVHTPGHSPGSVCLEAAGVLLTGDTLMATQVGRADMPGSDSATLRASVDLLARTYAPDTAIHPGHGESGTLGDAVAGLATASERQA